METQKKYRHKWDQPRRKRATCLNCGCEYHRGTYTIMYTMPDGNVYQKSPNCIKL